MSLFNEAVSNFLHDIATQPRYACYIVEGQLRVYIQGGEYIAYDPSLNQIIILDKYSAGLKPKKSNIDKELLKKVYQKLMGKLQPKETEDDLIKQKYGISSNRKLTEKQRREIQRYKASLEKGIGGA
jgi:hypothetical protein